MIFKDPNTGKTIKFNSLNGRVTDNDMWQYRNSIIEDIRDYGDFDRENHLLISEDSFDDWYVFFEENGWEYIEND